jgi:hypothetical protein
MLRSKIFDTSRDANVSGRFVGSGSLRFKGGGGRVATIIELVAFAAKYAQAEIVAKLIIHHHLRKLNRTYVRLF